MNKNDFAPEFVDGINSMLGAGRMITNNKTVNQREGTHNLKFFSRSKTTQSMNLRNLGIISSDIVELMETLPGFYNIFPAVPWKEIESKWDKELIWGCGKENFGDPAILWDTLTVVCPKVLKNLEAIFTNEPAVEIGEIPTLREIRNGRDGGSKVHLRIV